MQGKCPQKKSIFDLHHCGLKVFLLGLVLSCYSVAVQAAEMEVIDVALTSDIRSTDPGVNRDANTDTVMMHVLEGLVAYREDGSTGPLLADFVDISEDEKTYTFHLRSGVRFHNGDLLKAEHVVWTWKRYLDPATGWGCLASFDGSNGDKIESIEAVGDDAVVFKLNHPQPMFLSQMAVIHCGASGIIHPSSLNADGSWNRPVATGPYMLGKWVRGQYIELDAFADYQSRVEPRDGNTGGKIAYATKIKWLIIRDSAARLAALSKGQVQAMPELPAAEMLQVRRMHNVQIISKPMLVNYGILIQDRDTLLSDVRMRKALAMSIDRTTVASLVTEDVGVANASVIPSSSVFHSDIQKQSDGFHPDRVKRILDEIGYKGQPIKLVTNRRYPAMFNQALLVQAMARQAGINIELEVIEWATQIDRWRSGNYQLMSFGYSARADPYFNYQSILGDRDANKTKLWDKPEAIDLLAESARVSDPDKRQQLFNELHTLMIEDCPIIVLYSLSDVNAVRTSIKGFNSWVFGRARFWGVKRMEEGS
ncbi:ABC transporter substrate-binding protein [Kordiimonas pumila]|uniref:ABC transporter substrate-binding protein n=1 Tax=Kordiimonas pumila TaxID=2161677 RepID=A0ABV7D4K2_9PROT|nr:ABC transporter substrate-binding protein [Kordiimonas pumila]